MRQFNPAENLQEAIIKHESGLLLQEDGTWFGEQFRHDQADDMLDTIARAEENEVNDILEERYN